MGWPEEQVCWPALACRLLGEFDPEPARRAVAEIPDGVDGLVCGPSGDEKARGFCSWAERMG